MSCENANVKYSQNQHLVWKKFQKKTPGLHNKVDLMRHKVKKKQT